MRRNGYLKNVSWMILGAIHRVLNDKDFHIAMVDTPPPFGDGTAYRHITETLAEIIVDERLLNKRMSY